MNNKTALGLVVAIIVIGIALFALQKHVPQTVQIPIGNTPAETGASTTEPITASTSANAGVIAPAPTTTVKPAVTVQQTAPTQVTPAPHKPRIVAIDTSSLTSSGHAVITGAANVSVVALVIDDPDGVGIAGSSEVTVDDGHWTFAVPQLLKKGTYTVHVIGGDQPLIATLVVK